MSICAVEFVRRMRGGAQSQLMRTSDGALYVVKFQNNPQGKRVLANEIIATRLAQIIGLPVAPCTIIEVHSMLIERTPELRIEYQTHSEPCSPGLQAGSWLVGQTKTAGPVWDWLPVAPLRNTSNLNAFAGMLVFDWWTFNRDSRQAVFSKIGCRGKYAVTFIDQGYCFNGTRWSFPETSVPCLYSSTDVYALIDRWSCFEPWLSGIERLPESVLWEVVADIPEDWDAPRDAIKNLVNALKQRQNLVREFIDDLRCSARSPFRRWRSFHTTQYFLEDRGPSQCSA